MFVSGPVWQNPPAPPTHAHAHAQPVIHKCHRLGGEDGQPINQQLLGCSPLLLAPGCVTLAGQEEAPGAQTADYVE